MVYHPTVSRPELVRREPGVFLEVRRNRHVGIRHGTVGRDLERLEKCEDQIRLANRPAFGELRRLRQVGVVPPGSPAIDPGGNRVDLGLREARVVLVGANAGVGAPGRHLPGQHLGLHGARPGTGVVVSHQRHRRQVVRPVTGHAVLEQDGRDVLGERRGPLRRRRAGNAGCSQHQQRRTCPDQRRRYSHLISSGRTNRTLAYKSPV